MACGNVAALQPFIFVRYHNKAQHKQFYQIHRLIRHRNDHFAAVVLFTPLSEGVSAGVPNNNEY
jgi:hypothetical protein